MGDRNVRDGAAPPLLPPPCPREWGVKKAVTPFGHGSEKVRELGQEEGPRG